MGKFRLQGGEQTLVERFFPELAPDGVFQHPVQAQEGAPRPVPEYERGPQGRQGDQRRQGAECGGRHGASFGAEAQV